MRLLPKNGRFLIWDVYPDSPADKAKLWYGDEIVSINHEALGEHWNEGKEEGHPGPISLTIIRHGKELEMQLQAEKNNYFTKHQLSFQQ
jgi:C-terminal processing protease CtpA/Prc